MDVLGWRSVSVWYQSGNSLFFVTERKERISPCHPEERDNRLIQRTGMCEEEGDKHRYQKWKGRYVISERDWKTWKQRRDTQQVQEI